MSDDDRKNVKVKEETWDELREEKRPSETWDEFLLGLVEQAPRKAETVRIEDGQVREIVRETANEIEGRLR